MTRETEQQSTEHLRQASENIQVAIGRMALWPNLDLQGGAQNIVEIRPYQVDAWQALHDARVKGSSSALLHMATGLGKTMVAAGDVANFLHEKEQLNEPPSKVLFLAHQLELVGQAKRKFEELFPQKTSVEFSSRTNKRGRVESDFTFATLQAIASKLDRFDPDEFDYIIVDESHHSMADTFLSTISYFKPEFLLGVTATPFRGDEKDLADLFGETVYSKDLPGAMVEGFLAQPDYRLQMDDIVAEALSADIFSTGELNNALFIPKRNEEISRIILEAMEEQDNPRAIVFCKDIEHTEEMTRWIPGAVAIHSGVEDRDKRLQDFRDGRIQIITAVDMFNEGIDVPETSVVAFLRSTNSRIIFEQQLGRGLRLAEGKEKLTVLDFVGNAERLVLIQETADLIRKSFIKDKLDKDPDSDDVQLKEIQKQADKYLEQLGFVFDEKTIDIIERFKEVSSGKYEYADEEWVSTGEIMEMTQASQTKVIRTLEELGAQKRIMTRKLGKPGFFYTRADAQKAIDILNENPVAPEGWLSATSAAKNLNITLRTLNRLAKENEIEPTKMRAKLGKVGMCYSPEQIAQLRILAGPVLERASEEHRSLDTFSTENGIPKSLVVTIAEHLGIVPAKLKSARGQAVGVYFNPEQQKLIQEALPKDAPADWLAADMIQKRYGIGYRTVKQIADNLGIQPQIQRATKGGKITERYSPEQIDQIVTEYNKIGSAPEGYMTTSQIVEGSSLNHTSATYHAKKLELEGTIFRNKNGRPTVFYSPDQVEIIKSKLNLE